MKIILLSFLLLSPVFLFAQDFNDTFITNEEMDLKSYEKDPDAPAVVLKEFGDTRITDDEQANIIFKYHAKIKIFKNKGFDQGNVVIPVYFADNNNFESVSDIEATTYYKDDNGMIQSQILDKSKIFREKSSKHWGLIKFAMPNIREGSVIDYRYTLKSPFRFNLRKWEFQSSIPKLYSEYLVHIPAAFEYNVALTGPLKLSKNEGVLEKDCFNMGANVKADCSKITYRINNVPGFVEEENMTSPGNFRSAINFELAQVIDYKGIKHKVTQEWKDIELLLKRHESYGSQLKKKDLFKDQVSKIIANTAGEYSMAKGVYNYIKGWYKWNQQTDIMSESLKKAYESHSGSIADINLSLAAALSAAGLKPETVILSTRDNGFVSKLYPTLSNFNYVIVKLDIEGKTYLLDASEPLLPFGLLPLRCINDQGRVISLDKPSYWIDMVASQKETKLFNADLILQDNGKLVGTITKISMGYEAFNKRKTIKSFNSVDEFVEDFDEKWPKTKILKSQIVNLDSLDNSLNEIYTVEMDAFDNLNSDKFYFNPFFLNRLIENPFKLSKRSYPVDLGAMVDTRININVTLPKKFSLVGQPDDLALSLPNEGGKFVSSTLKEDNKFRFSETKLLNKSIYAPEEYASLKEFYNKIVQLQKTDIVFQKSK